MMNFAELDSFPADPGGPSQISCGSQWPPTWPTSQSPLASTPHQISAATFPSAQSAAWTRWLRGARIWSCTSAGCRRSVGSSPPPSPGASRSAAGVLPHLRHRRPPGALTSRACFRRPTVPAESPTLGFTHLQFEALLTAARESSHPCDFALVAMLGLLGLRIFEATGADIADLGEEHFIGCCASAVKAPRSSGSRCRQRSAGHRPRDRIPHRRADPPHQPGRPHRLPRSHRRLRHIAEAA